MNPYGFRDIHSVASDFVANVYAYNRPPVYGAYGLVLNSSVIDGKNLEAFFGPVSRMFDVEKYVYNA